MNFAMNFVKACDILQNSWFDRCLRTRFCTHPILVALVDTMMLSCRRRSIERRVGNKTSISSSTSAVQDQCSRVMSTGCETDGDGPTTNAFLPPAYGRRTAASRKATVYPQGPRAAWPHPVTSSSGDEDDDDDLASTATGSDVLDPIATPAGYGLPNPKPWIGFDVYSDIAGTNARHPHAKSAAAAGFRKSLVVGTTQQERMSAVLGRGLRDYCGDVGDGNPAADSVAEVVDTCSYLFGSDEDEAFKVIADALALAPDTWLDDADAMLGETHAGRRI